MLLDITVPPDITELRRIRRLTAAWLEDGLDPGPVQLVVTELVTNAMEASPPDAPVRLQLRTNGGVTVVVHDHGPGLGERQIEPVPAHHTRGRGLFIVSRLAEIEIERRGEVTSVTARIDPVSLRRSPERPPRQQPASADAAASAASHWG